MAIAACDVVNNYTNTIHSRLLDSEREKDEQTVNSLFRTVEDYARALECRMDLCRKKQMARHTQSGRVVRDASSCFTKKPEI